MNFYCCFNLPIIKIIIYKLTFANYASCIPVSVSKTANVFFLL